MVGTRPFAEPTCWSLRPWVTAGSRPARGGWGVLPVAVMLLPGVFIGVLSVLLVVDVKCLGLQPYGQVLGHASGAPWEVLRLAGLTLGTCRHAIHLPWYIGFSGFSRAFLSQKNFFSQ